MFKSACLHGRTFDLSIMVEMYVYCCGEVLLQLMHDWPQSLVKYMNFIVNVILEGIYSRTVQQK